jgi:hypothetical protein
LTLFSKLINKKVADAKSATFFIARCIVAKAPPVVDEAKRGWRSGQNS